MLKVTTMKGIAIWQEWHQLLLKKT
jgi:hypothetical protein